VLSIRKLNILHTGLSVPDVLFDLPTVETHLQHLKERGSRGQARCLTFSATARRSSLACVEIATEMGSSNASVQMTWTEICSHGDFRGRWVALDGVRYDETTARPTAGTVVDADEDLAELCQRIRKSNHRSCAILFCEGHEPVAPPMRMPRARHAAH
jgi:hypothetical protein